MRHADRSEALGVAKDIDTKNFHHKMRSQKWNSYSTEGAFCFFWCINLTLWKPRLARKMKTKHCVRQRAIIYRMFLPPLYDLLYGTHYAYKNWYLWNVPSVTCLCCCYSLCPSGSILVVRFCPNCTRASDASVQENKFFWYRSMRRPKLTNRESLGSKWWLSSVDFCPLLHLIIAVSNT